MSMLHDSEPMGFIVVKNLYIQGANAISGPLTYGFPSLTNFTGLVHSLSRKLDNYSGLDKIELDGVLVACSHISVKRYRNNSFEPWVFSQMRAPIDSSGKTASIIESGRCDVDVHLIIGVFGDVTQEQELLLCEKLRDLLLTSRVAGGSVYTGKRHLTVEYCDFDSLDNYKKQLLPAFVLMDAHDQLVAITGELRKANPKATMLDGLIELSVINEEVRGNASSYHSVKTGRGWLVPIPVGYQGISDPLEPGQLDGARDSCYSTQFVETIYSAGRWVFPSRLDSLHEALWFAHHEPEQGLFVVRQGYFDSF